MLPFFINHIRHLQKTGHSGSKENTWDKKKILINLIKILNISSKYSKQYLHRSLNHYRKTSLSLKLLYKKKNLLIFALFLWHCTHPSTVLLVLTLTASVFLRQRGGGRSQQVISISSYLMAGGTHRASSETGEALGTRPPAKLY